MMTRRKSVYTKWTLVLLVVLVCPFAYSRPQDSSQAPVISSSTINIESDKPTENPLRYRHRDRRLRLDNKLPDTFSHVNNTNLSNYANELEINNTLPIYNRNVSIKTQIINDYSKTNISNSRKNRLITAIYSNDPNIHEHLKNDILFRKDVPKNFNVDTKDKKKTEIKKVITKWTDNTKYDDLDFTYETTTSDEKQDSVTFTNSIKNYLTTTEDSNEQSTEAAEKIFHPQDIKKIYNLFHKKHKHKPKPHHSDSIHVYSDNIYVTDRYAVPSNRPTYIFTTPTPTPIITNLGNPKPWSKPTYNVRRKTTTPKPVIITKPTKNQYNYYNPIPNYPHYPGNDFEVTTFEPSTAYTDRIVIRPEEYAASPDECPTIFLTLNNTFQGQGKEACPDLNIAVNTNVVNKNVVVETEEEETDSIFPGGFDVPFVDDLGDESGQDNYDSDENQEQESGSIEEFGLTNYNSPNAIQSESEPVSSASNPLSAIHKPGHHRPRPDKDDDDIFSVSSFLQFFKPAINAMSWIATINPMTFGLFSLLLSPLMFLFASTSGIAALIAPWAFSGRQAPKIVHVYRPHWHWDNELKTWQLHTFENDRWTSAVARSSGEETDMTPGRPTFFYKLKEWMRNLTSILRERNKSKINQQAYRKNRRKKRETWTKRIKEFSTKRNEEPSKTEVTTPVIQDTQNSGRDVKTKGPVIRESIKLVANQLLDKPSNASADTPILSDTRIPPKIKNQVHKHSIKTRNDDGDRPVENGHAGVAVPVTMEELEKENKISESSTTNEGISTWILLSNPANKENYTGSTEPTKVEESTKKHKPTVSKSKPKRPQNNKTSVVKRPIIGSTNKADLVAGGSAINENVFNKIKDTVLSNVQKNKNASTQRTSTLSSTTPATTTEILTTKKEAIKPPSTISPVVKITSKPIKKKNKNKHKTTTTLAPEINESALLPMEPKEQEIELEVSTPPSTTKKPKRSSTKKKNKTKRKTSKPKPETETSVSEIKTSNKTKSAKPAKKPGNQSGPITTQIYNYLSREVMPVGVGVLGLASLVGLASYFLYPFSTPVRRTFEVDKKDDIYRNNAEEYASEGNGQAEEEMLGTVLAGMPSHAKHKLNPYAGQTVSQTHGNRYTVKKEQDIRYRHVAANREPNYNVHYPQQKTGIAHGAIYSKPINYTPHQYETRNVYTTESKYTYDKGSNAYTPYSAVEPIYAAPQTGPSAVSSYGSDPSNSVVYGVKPTSDTDFRPVYPFEGQIYGETTSNPITYSPTSMYLGSNNDGQEQENNYEENETNNSGSVDNKFVVGNVPKELAESATPAVVPEHGPRKLRRKRHADYRKRSVRGTFEEILNETKNKDVFISNEIDDSFGYVKHIASVNEQIKNVVTVQPEVNGLITVYAVSVDPKDEKTTSTDTPSTIKTDIIESVSTVPISKSEKSTTEVDITNELDVTTKTFRVYEVFSNPTDATEQNSPLVKDETSKVDTTTFRNMMTETTTEVKSETTSTMPPSPSPVSEPVTKTTVKYKDTDPEVITYPPPNQENGLFSLLRRFLEFKYRLGLSILQTTSDNLKRYLEDTMKSAAKASN